MRRDFTRLLLSRLTLTRREGKREDVLQKEVGTKHRSINAMSVSLCTPTGVMSVVVAPVFLFRCRKILLRGEG